MFWTLLKILVFVAFVIALAWGAGALMDSGQTVGLRVADLEFSLGPVQAVIALGVLVLGLWLVLKFLGFLRAFMRFMVGDETALSRFFTRNREKRGLDALLESMLALASGDGKRAVAKAEKAHKLLDRPVMTSLLVAQAAEVKGNPALAEEHYKRLVTDPRSRFVGVQGLMRGKLEAGEKDLARELALKALDMKPDHGPTQTSLLELQAEAGDWTGARKTLIAQNRSGKLPRDIFRRRDAVLALQDATRLEAEGHTQRAHEAAIEANRLSPDLIPAAVAAARALAAEGKARYATKVIKKAWKVQPHPDLAAAFAAIEPDETPRQRLARFEPLLKLRADHPESRLLRAEFLIANEDFPAARRALGDLAEKDPGARALTVMAAIERGEGSSDAVVRGWLARALSAPRGGQWVCKNCHHGHAEWTARCTNCGAFDTLDWHEAPHTASVSGGGSEMLPLIVGQLGQPEPSDEADIIDADQDAEDTADAAEKKTA